MSQNTLLGHGRLRFAAPLTGRDPGEEHRAATPLELFFDLVFVVAVALAADRLHHGIIDGHAAEAIGGYALVFFAIYWAWVNFTWFASAYDNDDLVFRIFVFVTITGALIFAAGVPRAFDGLDFTVAVAGYTVMRTALVTQWLRVARHDGPRRLAARRFAIGLSLLQVGWLAILALPAGLFLAAWIVLAIGELVTPVWAESAGRTTWNAEHIAERYGLFMIIVLGESVLAASRALQTEFSGGGLTPSLVAVILGGLLIVFSIWWMYFERPDHRFLDSLRGAFTWSYLHLLVFAAVAAVGAGLAVAIEAAASPEVPPRTAAAAVAIPLVVFLVSLWGMYVRADDPPVRKVGVPIAVVVIAGAIFARSAAVLVMGLALTLLVVVKTASRVRADAALEP